MNRQKLYNFINTLQKLYNSTNTVQKAYQFANVLHKFYHFTKALHNKFLWIHISGELWVLQNKYNERINK